MALPPSQWLQLASSAGTADRIWTEGDSYMNGAFGVVLCNKIRTGTGRVTIDASLGGSALQAIHDRIASNLTMIRQCKLVAMCDGSGNGYGTPAASLALIDDIIAMVGVAHLLIIPSVQVGPSSDGSVTSYTLDMEAMRDGIASRGVATFDAVPICNALVTVPSPQDLLDISARVVCQSLLYDQTGGQVHLADTTMNAVYAKLAQVITANGL